MFTIINTGCQGRSHVTGVLFSVEQSGTLALCDLSFSSDLVEIESASVLVLRDQSYMTNMTIFRCLVRYYMII